MHNQLDYCFYSTGVEKVLLAVIVGRCSDNNKFCILIGHFRIQRSNKIKVLFCQIFFNIIVLDRGFAPVDEVGFFRKNVDCRHMVVLCEQGGNGETDVAGAGNRNA